MIRRFVGGAALAVLLATGAQAQVPFLEGFTYNGGTGTGQLFGSGSINALTGTFDLADPLHETFGTNPFQIWCVDDGHTVSVGDHYAVLVTPLSAAIADLVPLHDANGTKAYSDYAKAAFLTTAMSGTNDPAGGSFGGNTQIQLAIWQLMGYDVTLNTYYDGTNVTHWVNAANANCPGNVCAGITLNDWLVITDLDVPGHQEFLAHNPNRPQEVIPEPGTMAMLAMGLVGMAGAGLRRRKK